jgi:hypothetical protein
LISKSWMSPDWKLQGSRCLISSSNSSISSFP